MVVIALHNIAVQYEYLNQYQSAIHTYQKAFDYSKKHLGSAHPFTQKMEKVLQESTTKIKNVIEKQNKRLTSKYTVAEKKNPASSKLNSARMQREQSLADILQSDGLQDNSAKP